MGSIKECFDGFSHRLIVLFESLKIGALVELFSSAIYTILIDPEACQGNKFEVFGLFDMGPISV